MQMVRLVLKLHQFEVVTFGLALILLTVGTFIVTDRLGALGTQIAVCHDPFTCANLEENLARLKVQAGTLPALGVVVPIFAGVMLGVPIVAREVERGTASLAWTMSRSRRIWFIRRVAVLGVVLAAISLPSAVALEHLSGAIYSGVDLSHSFVEVETRGLIVVARAVTALGLASLAGALMGRVLPAVLLALCGCAAVFLTLQLADDAWLRLDAALLPASVSAPSAYIVDVGYQLPDGRVVDWNAAWAALGDPTKSPADVFPQRYIGVPGEVAPEKRAREIGVILVVGLAAVAAATVTVDRRRPY
jgi:hypothetical protein